MMIINFFLNKLLSFFFKIFEFFFFKYDDVCYDVSMTYEAYEYDILFK